MDELGRTITVQVQGNLSHDTSVQQNGPIFNIHTDASSSQEEKRQKCIETLLVTDPRDDRLSLITARGKVVAGTCEWIAKNESCHNWLHSSDTQLLWISGDPGKGKTMLSIFLTEGLEKITQKKYDAHLAYYFCSNGDRSRNTEISILRSLLYQIFTERPALADHLLLHFNGTANNQTIRLTAESLWVVFKRVLLDPELQTIFCVIDGLDECNDGPTFLERLVDFFSSESSRKMTGQFKGLILSRDMPVHWIFPRLRLGHHTAEITSDIERFISTRVRDLSDKLGLDEKYRAWLQKTLLERAEGTFLWIGYVMHELSRNTTRTQMSETLDALPIGLSAIYDRMKSHIDQQRRHTSFLILRWVAMVLRPLTLQELPIALGIESSTNLSTDQGIRDRIYLCGSFLEVRGNQVRLIHKSVKDYFLEMPPGTLKEFVSPQQANMALARTCLDRIKSSGSRNLDEEQPLLSYAVQFWPEHMNLASTDANRLFEELDHFFKKDSPLFKKWWKAYCDRFRNPDLSSSMSPLHIASYFGISPWVLSLVRNGSKLSRQKPANKKDKRQRTPLYYAASGGHEEVVILLLQKGANVNASDLKRRTALHVAANNGHNKVTELLIEAKANVNAKDEKERTPLHKAASNGHKKVVRLLLKGGAISSTVDVFDQTAEHNAVKKRSEDLAQLLRKKNSKAKGTASPVMRDGEHKAAVQRFEQNKAPFSTESLNSSIAVSQDEEHGITQQPDGERPPVLFLAVSQFEFNLFQFSLFERKPEYKKMEASFPYLSYEPGEIFDVLYMRGELWLARKQEDPEQVIGWIWEKHFARIISE